MQLADCFLIMTNCLYIFLQIIWLDFFTKSFIRSPHILKRFQLFKISTFTLVFLFFSYWSDKNFDFWFLSVNLWYLIYSQCNNCLSLYAALFDSSMQVDTKSKISTLSFQLGARWSLVHDLYSHIPILIFKLELNILIIWI